MTQVQRVFLEKAVAFYERLPSQRREDRELKGSPKAWPVISALRTPMLQMSQLARVRPFELRDEFRPAIAR
jgi:hypothetical protein